MTEIKIENLGEQVEISGTIKADEITIITGPGAKTVMSNMRISAGDRNQVDFNVKPITETGE